jgi:hypothetical protein
MRCTSTGCGGVRQVLGSEAADAAWAEGCASSLDEAITYALGSGQRIFGIAVFVAFDPFGPVLLEGPHQLQAGFLHHATRGDVDDHGRGNHALQVDEAFPNQRARSLSRIALTPASRSSLRAQ